MTLSGTIPSLSHKRLAGVLAWWVPGTRDVRNDLNVVPPEGDDDGELNDAVHIVLDKDPLIDSSGVQVQVQDGVVALHGLVSKHGDRDMAERDAWYVEGVRDVRNELSVMKRKLSE